ncbi:MAG: hypothetical protein MUP98_09710 [Candidatus Aminicenantes bacterium]|nr:hypothetical protein [Candidatus Aminicenantes bacterium]
MMKKLLDVFIIGAVLSLIIGSVSRVTMRPFPFGIEAQAYLQFSQTLLLFAIAIGIRELLQKNKD